MRSICTVVALAWAMLLGSVAWADTQPQTQYKAASGPWGAPSTWYPTAQQAADATAAAYCSYAHTSNCTGILSASPPYCVTVHADPNGNGGSNVTTCLQLPTQVVQVDLCGPHAGESRTTNFTMAWIKDPNAADQLGPSNVVGNYVGPHLGDNVCQSPTTGMGACGGTLSAATGQGWISLTPGPNGLYRASLDVKVTNTGASCNYTSGGAADPNMATPPCPGVLGSVNGTPKCIAAVGGSLPGPSNTASAPQSGIPVTAANPAAGDVPSTGQGSGQSGQGRTPFEGNGTATGGPSSAAGGTLGGGGYTGGGGGTNPNPDQNPTCGYPGGPPCKIDESGTPNTGDLSAATAALATNQQSSTDLVNAQGTSTGKDTSWHWSFTFPSGCSVYTVWSGGPTIDVCAMQPRMHDLMTMVWVGIALVGCVMVVTQTFLGGN